MQPERFTTRPVAATASFDAGLRAHFQRVYNTMAVGLGVTGLVAWIVANTPALSQTLLTPPIVWAVMFAPMVFCFIGFTPNAIRTRSVGYLNAMFYAFSAVFGISLAAIFLVYSGESIARVFFITAGMFAATSIFGYTTKKDLSGMGGLMIMGAIGIFIAIIVNIFLKSEMLMFVTSVIGVIVYTGLTAWDTQRIKESYNAAHGDESNAKMAVMGALSMYLNFIMLFQFMLSLLGNRE